MQWLKRDEILTLRRDRAARRACSPSTGRRRDPADRRRADLRPDLPDAGRAARADRRASRPVADHQRLPARRLAGPLAEAGLTRINVSLDTLHARPLHQIARRDASTRCWQASPSSSATRAPPDQGQRAWPCATSPRTRCRRFAELARRKPYVVRFIEFMPLDADGNWQRERVLTGAEISAIIESDFMPLVPIAGRSRRRPPGASASPTASGEIGFISPVSRAVLRHLQPDPPDRRRPAAHVPVLASTSGICGRRCATGASDDELRDMLRERSATRS